MPPADPSVPAPPRVHHALRSLRHRNYRLFFGGQLISLIGTWMQNVAQSWLVYRLTGSEALLGLVGFAGLIPIFLLSPFGGAIADRADRRRILIATQTASLCAALALALLTLLGAVTVWHVVGTAVTLGIVNAVDVPTRQAFVPGLVGEQDLPNAIALNSSMFNGARIVGPAVAGVVLSAVGEGWCFAANAVSFLAVIVGLVLMDVPAHVPQRQNLSTMAQIAEGFRFAWNNVPIRALLLLLGIVSLTGMPYSVLMPVFADRILHGGAGSLGFLMAASGCGALAGALLLASRREIRGLGLWIAFAAAGFGASLILFSFSRTLWLSIAFLVPAGFTMIVQMASSNTLVQTMVPDKLRGRVMSVYSMMFLGMAPFGSLLAGALAERIGAPTTVAAGGAVCLAGALLLGRRLPALRDGGTAPRRDESPGEPPVA
ncbi:MAG TPA: MFS transporter [Thermoanaerobaculia bacterium]|nr:MFS transporter [Thermoanaerobaculia bacterium]